MKAACVLAAMALACSGCGGETLPSPNQDDLVLVAGVASVTLAVPQRAVASSPDAQPPPAEIDLPPANGKLPVHITAEHVHVEIVEGDARRRMVLGLEGREGAWLGASLRDAARRGRVRLVAAPEAPWKLIQGLLDMALSPEGEPTQLDLAVADERLDFEVARVSLVHNSPFGLTARLGKGGARIELHGNGWVRALGCDAVQFVQDFDDLGPKAVSAWAARLDEVLRLSESKGQRADVSIRTDDSTTVADVAPFVEAAILRDIVPLDLGVHLRDAVDHAPVRWLPAHQLPNGAWHEEHSLRVCEGRPFAGSTLPDRRAGDVLLTARVLFSMLSLGYTNRGKHPNARVVGKGLRYLKNSQHADGSFRRADESPVFLRDAWAALALIEAYGMTESPLFKRPAQRALSNVERTWWPDEGAVTTAMAAAAVHSATLINQDALRRGKPAPLAIDGSIADRLLADARARNARRADLDAAAAIYTRHVLGEPIAQDANAIAGLSLLRAHMREAGRDVDPTLTYFLALGSFGAGGKGWDRTKALLETYLDVQRRDGAYCCMKGSADPPPGVGRVEATAYFALSIELFYRYDRVFGTR